MNETNDMTRTIDFARQSAWFYGCIAGALSFIGIVGAWESGLGFMLFVLGIPLLSLVLLAGTMAFVVSAWRQREDIGSRTYRVATFATAPVLMVLVVLLSLPSLWAGSYVGVMSRLLVERDKYEAIIARVRTHQEEAWHEDYRGVTYSVDPGPPVRVAFNPAGLLDNWSGIIYDPTGEVMLADGFDPATGVFRAPDRITKLFSGDLVGCRHLWGDYYSCSFT